MKTKIVIMTMSLVLISTTNIFNTSGRLSGGSIVTCNGETYGSHSKTDPHYHVAEKKESGYWYPNGGVVSKTNPCNTQTAEVPKKPNSNKETTPVKDTSKTPSKTDTVKAQEIEKNKKLEAERVEKARIENEKIKAEQIEKERIENERIKAEQQKIENERLLLEKARLENTEVKEILYKGSKIKDFVQEFDYKELMIQSENQSARVDIYENDIKPFRTNKIEYSVTSENGEKTKDFSNSFYFIGSQLDLQKAEIVLIGKKTSDLNYTDNIKIKSKDLKSGFNQIEINGEIVDIYNYRFSEDKIHFDIEGVEFFLPYTESSSNVGAVAFLIFTAGIGIFYLFKKM